MIELPRACFDRGPDRPSRRLLLVRDERSHAVRLGFSRDDVEGRIIPRYIEEKIVDASPFATIDEPGVGELVRIAVEQGPR